jgi:hypothetical protein
MGDVQNHPNLTCIGQMAVFYIPSAKLDDVRYGAFYQTPRQLIHHFVIDNYDAYTHQQSDIQGFWRQGRGGRIVHDRNEMFEVSFLGAERVWEFVDFLATLCHLLEEECLYLTMGFKAWLVSPRPSGLPEMKGWLKPNS